MDYACSPGHFSNIFYTFRPPVPPWTMPAALDISACAAPGTRPGAPQEPTSLTGGWTPVISALLDLTARLSASSVSNIPENISLMKAHVIVQFYELRLNGHFNY